MKRSISIVAELVAVAAPIKARSDEVIAANSPRVNARGYHYVTWSGLPPVALRVSAGMGGLR